MRKYGVKPLNELSNEEALEEYSFYNGWAHDDFCLTDMDDEDHDRMYELEKEILSRMK